VDDECKAKIIFAHEVKILDISSGGMLFETTRRMNTNSRYRVQISSDKGKMAPLCTVVRATLKGAIKSGEKGNVFTLDDGPEIIRLKGCEKTIPYYPVAVAFQDLNDNEKIFLKDLLASLSRKHEAD
jgi:hypothetical protein